MEDFRNKFIEEANDLINALESSLFILEEAKTDKDMINEVFRIMHSLKGGGAMFGFEKISEFTHNLENIYDEIRAGKSEISNALLNVTFESVDHLRNLLVSEEEINSNPKLLEKHKDLSATIQKMVDAGNQTEAETSTENQIPEPDEAKEASYYIYFKPNADVFDNGTNPLFITDDLRALGKCKIFTRETIPTFGKFDFSVCYTYWELILQTTESVLEINDVFMFVEDECELEIKKIGDYKLAEDENFIAKLETLNVPERFDYQTIKSILNNIRHPQTKEKQQQHKVSEKIKKFSKESEITSIRIATEKIDQYMNLVSELVTAQAALKMFTERNKSPELLLISETIENITEQIRDNALSISLIPIENTIIRFRRLVRDLSSGFNKNIKFTTEGTDTRIDKTLLQIITDPLMHIIRNCIDHGIESPEERLAAGKDEQGHITLRAYYSGSNVNIEVEDDGNGIDTDKVLKKAVEKGMISPEAQFSQKDALKLIFQPGFSTAETVTDISGRGVGMDVLKRKIADARGDIEIESKKGEGTKITLKLPITLSIIDGLLVKIEKSLYVVPLTSISRIKDVQYKDLENSFQNILDIDNEQIPFYILRDELLLGGTHPEEVKFIIVKYENRKVGIVFDEIIGEYQAVLKPLGKLYRKHEIITGASILGDGNVALVLDPNKIIKKFSAQAKS